MSTREIPLFARRDFVKVEKNAVHFALETEGCHPPTLALVERSGCSFELRNREINAGRMTVLAIDSHGWGGASRVGDIAVMDQSSSDVPQQKEIEELRARNPVVALG